MKGIACLLICLLVLGAGAASAEEEWGLEFEGKVVAGEQISVRAPFSGAVHVLDAQSGGRVRAGQTLFRMETIKLYAPLDGKVAEVFGDVGDDLRWLKERHGGLLFVEPERFLQVKATTDEAFNSSRNRYVHMGESVCVRSKKESSRKGTGRVVAVKGKEYTVEVLSGNLRYDELVNVFRGDSYAKKSRIGAGSTQTVESSPIGADAGYVLRLWAQRGDEVKKGDLLAEYVKEPLPLSGPSPELTALREAILMSVAVEDGALVEAGALLATLAPVDALCLSAKLGEMEMLQLSIGQAVEVEFDGVLQKGQIDWIAYAPDEEGNYEIRIKVNPISLRLGQTAQVSTEVQPQQEDGTELE